MKATVKWFNAPKGYGFITDSESKKDVFVHHSNIIMDGYKILNEDDIAEYDLGTGRDGREQAVNVTPILTRQMIEKELKKDSLHIQVIKANLDTLVMNTLGMNKSYMVVDENNMIQSDANGMSFLELAAYAGFDTDGLSEIGRASCRERVFILG